MATVANPVNVVHTALNYYLDPSKGGHSSYVAGTASYFQRKFDQRPVDIQNARGHEADFKLDTHGFQYYKHTSAEKDFTDDERVKSIVYPEIQQLVKEVTGASDVHVFSHIARRQNHAAIEASLKSKPNISSDTPVSGTTAANYIHVDQSPKGAHQVLRDNIPESSPLLKSALEKGSRWAIVNVWRPISRIRRDPLAFCDARSISDENLKPIKIMLPLKGSDNPYAVASKGDGMEVFYASWSEGQKWYFFRGMEPDEVTFIKCYDSIKDDNVAKRCPHSAFEWIDGDGNVSTRESVEVRCLVFWDVKD